MEKEPKNWGEIFLGLFYVYVLIAAIIGIGVLVYNL